METEAGIDFNMRKLLRVTEVYADLDHSDGVMNVYFHVFKWYTWGIYGSYFNYASMTL